MTNPAPNVKIKHTDIAKLVRDREGEALKEKDVVYEFTGGREFKDTGANGGPYNQSS